MGHDADMLRRRNRELSILNSIAQALNQSVNLSQTLQAVLAEVADLLDLQTGWIWLYPDGSSASYLAAAQNLPPVLTQDPDRMRGSCYCLRTFQEGDLAGAANVNVVECSRLYGLTDGTDGLSYHASIPLYAHGKKMGVLNVASTDWRELSPQELKLLYTVGDMLGIAIERARLFSQSIRLGALEERNRLAREIHDTLAQGLTAVSLQLESVDAMLDANMSVENIQATIQHALQLTRANLEEARRSMMDLRAAPLEGKTLPDALADLVANFNADFKIELNIDRVAPQLSPQIELGLFRIVQEALSNISSHANAALVFINLRQEEAQLVLEIEDDGVGFDPAYVPENRFGLVGMSERARLMNGRLQVDTTPGEGTKITIQIPIQIG